MKTTLAALSILFCLSAFGGGEPLNPDAIDFEACRKQMEKVAQKAIRPVSQSLALYELLTGQSDEDYDLGGDYDPSEGNDENSVVFAEVPSALPVAPLPVTETSTPNDTSEPRSVDDLIQDIGEQQKEANSYLLSQSQLNELFNAAKEGILSLLTEKASWNLKIQKWIKKISQTQKQQKNAYNIYIAAEEAKQMMLDRALDQLNLPFRNRTEKLTRETALIGTPGDLNSRSFFEHWRRQCDRKDLAKAPRILNNHSSFVPEEVLPTLSAWSLHPFEFEDSPTTVYLAGDLLSNMEIFGEQAFQNQNFTVNIFTSNSYWNIPKHSNLSQAIQLNLLLQTPEGNGDVDGGDGASILLSRAKGLDAVQRKEFFLWLSKFFSPTAQWVEPLNAGELAITEAIYPDGKLTIHFIDD